MHDNKMHTDKLKIREVTQLPSSEKSLDGDKIETSEFGQMSKSITIRPSEPKAGDGTENGLATWYDDEIISGRKRFTTPNIDIFVEPMHEAAKRSHVEFARYCMAATIVSDDGNVTLDDFYDNWMKSKTENK